MIGDETILDAPVTPAPIFAYRALRGIFFGSPDDTPVRAASVAFSSNTAPTEKSDASTTEMSGTAAAENKRASLFAVAAPDLTSTFQDVNNNKRKRSNGGASISLLSPTKSCLRTPGAITPRRVMLKDVNVTFKDHSASPEARRMALRFGSTNGESQDSKPLTAKSLSYSRMIQPNSKSSDTTVTHNINDGGASPSKTNRRSVTATETNTTTKLPTVLPVVNMLTDQQDRTNSATTPFDVDAYIKSTETDMKKLIRYGQKMREYARKQDEENAKLKRLIEELQHENQRLKRKFSLTDRLVNVDGHKTTDADTIDEVNGRNGGGRRAQTLQAAASASIPITKRSTSTMLDVASKTTEAASSRKRHRPDVGRIVDRPQTEKDLFDLYDVPRQSVNARLSNHGHSPGKLQPQARKRSIRTEDIEAALQTSSRRGPTTRKSLSDDPPINIPLRVSSSIAKSSRDQRPPSTLFMVPRSDMNVPSLPQTSQDSSTRQSNIAAKAPNIPTERQAAARLRLLERTKQRKGSSAVASVAASSIQHINKDPSRPTTDHQEDKENTPSQHFFPEKINDHTRSSDRFETILSDIDLANKERRREKEKESSILDWIDL